MATYKFPVAFIDEDTSVPKHKPMVDGQLLEPVVIPISGDTGNSAEIRDDGIYVQASQDITIVSNAACNLISVGNDGGARLCADEMLTEDTECINLLVATETGIRLCASDFVADDSNIIIDDDGKIGVSIPTEQTWFPLAFNPVTQLRETIFPSAFTELILESSDISGALLSAIVLTVRSGYNATTGTWANEIAWTSTSGPISIIPNVRTQFEITTAGNAEAVALLFRVTVAEES